MDLGREKLLRRFGMERDMLQLFLSIGRKLGYPLITDVNDLHLRITHDGLSEAVRKFFCYDV